MSTSRYVDSKVRVAVDRSVTEHVAKLEMLRGFGFACSTERHCGFWLIHYQFPQLKLVSGHAIIGSAK